MPAVVLAGKLTAPQALSAILGLRQSKNLLADLHIAISENRSKFRYGDPMAFLESIQLLIVKTAGLSGTIIDDEKCVQNFEREFFASRQVRLPRGWTDLEILLTFPSSKDDLVRKLNICL